jgi:hypothetical protein
VLLLRTFFLLWLGATVALSEPVDDRPYPLLEFFLARQCIERDVAVTSLLQDLGRNGVSDPRRALRAYDLVSRARRLCAADRVAAAIADYHAAADALCGQGHGALSYLDVAQVPGPGCSSEGIVSFSLAGPEQ